MLTVLWSFQLQHFSGQHLFSVYRTWHTYYEPRIIFLKTSLTKFPFVVWYRSIVCIVPEYLNYQALVSWHFNQLSRNVVIVNIVQTISNSRFSQLTCLVWTVVFFQYLKYYWGFIIKNTSTWLDIMHLIVLIKNMHYCH